VSAADHDRVVPRHAPTLRSALGVRSQVPRAVSGKTERIAIWLAKAAAGEPSSGEGPPNRKGPFSSLQLSGPSSRAVVARDQQPIGRSAACPRMPSNNRMPVWLGPAQVPTPWVRRSGAWLVLAFIMMGSCSGQPSDDRGFPRP
jgi:hypothetical protein